MGFQDVAKAISKVGALDFSGISKAMSLDASNLNQVARNVAHNTRAPIVHEMKDLSAAMKNMTAGSEELANATARMAELQQQSKALRGASRTGTIDSVNATLKDVTGKDKMGYLRFAQGYFGDATYGKTRRNVTLGAYAGVAVGGRLLSGGNFTTNAQGERDIAGIPFI